MWLNYKLIHITSIISLIFKVLIFKVLQFKSISKVLRILPMLHKTYKLINNIRKRHIPLISTKYTITVY